MIDLLEPNRIHSLPVRVHYQIPSSSQYFTTVLPETQQVYVYPNAGAQNGEADDQAWGSIYLKTVVQGVVSASPEVHPAFSSLPDFSLYILDPRETYLRRSRAPASPYPSHLRSSNASSSPLLQPPSSPQNATPAEVWTGKGLVGWALDEPGVGKNLITGRLLRSSEFTSVVRNQGLSPMEALMALHSGSSDHTESWGIEVSVGLKSSAGGSIGLHPQISQVMSMETVPRRQSFTSNSDRASSPAAQNQFQPPRHPPVPNRNPQSHSQSQSQSQPQSQPQLPSAVQPLAPARRVSTTTPVVKVKHEAKKALSTGRKRKNNTAATASRQLSNVGTNSGSGNGRGSTSSSDESDSAVHAIPAEVFINPQSLTKEQAQRLIASPFFRNTLQKLTGEPVYPASAKRPREPERVEEAAKKPKLDNPWKGSSGGPSKADKDVSKPIDDDMRCYNCGRTKSAVWRQRVMEDGQSVRVCNACGLYFNKQGSMRPPTMWEGVDDEVKLSRSKTPTANSSSEPDMPAPRMDSGFKRTLSAVAEKDSQRIANMRKQPAAKSNLGHGQPTRAAPKTSPPRSSASAVKSVRNTSGIVNNQAAASSPGGWVKPASSTVSESAQPTSSAFVAQDSPNTAIRRILGTADKPVKSLDMPLSDDGRGDSEAGTSRAGWGTDLSTFFDVEGFEMAAGPNGATSIRSPTPAPTEFHRSLSSERRRRREQERQSQSETNSHAPSSSTEEDDALSQLFNRTSSIGPMESSPAPFDFSQLPPSSPPSIPSDLPHSALLLSSPDNSPMGFSPLDRIPNRVSPDKKSNLKHSFTPDYTNHQTDTNIQYDTKHDSQLPSFIGMGDHTSLNFDSLEDILGSFSDNIIGTGSDTGEFIDSTNAHMSSTMETEGLMGLEGDELLAFINSFTGTGQ